MDDIVIGELQSFVNLAQRRIPELLHQTLGPVRVFGGIILSAGQEKNLITARPYNNGAVQTTGVADETVGGIDFEEEMIAGNLRIVIVQAEMGSAASVVTPQEKRVRFGELETLSHLRSFDDRKL